METAVQISHLTVLLGGDFKALDDITLSLPVGKTIAVIGPSGAGKTTLIRTIVGRLHVPAGQVKIFGLNAGTPKLRHEMTYMTQELSVYPDLTVSENIRYFATMAGISRKKLPHVIHDILSAVDLSDKTKRLVSSLSGGQKQRVSLAIALIGSPKIMVLDEPTVGLDPVLRVKLWALFDTLAAQGTTLIVSSHSMDEAEHCDDLVLIRDGQLISHSTPGELKQRTGCATIEGAFLQLVGEQHES